MSKNNRDNLTKNDISKIINSKYGVPILYAEKFIDDFISIINSTLKKANLIRPKDGYMATGSRNGIHTEYLGFLLAEMQFLPRSYPDAKW